jgi:hypothetical protein
MENNFYKQCETCQGDAYVIVNSTFNDNPQFDEHEQCPICNTGLVPNNEVIQECLDKWEDVVSIIIEARNERIKREEEFFYKLAEHQYRLKNKLSNN